MVRVRWTRTRYTTATMDAAGTPLGTADHPSRHVRGRHLNAVGTSGVTARRDGHSPHEDHTMAPMTRKQNLHWVDMTQGGDFCWVGDNLHVILPGASPLPARRACLRCGEGFWLWNGDRDLPTLKPSVNHMEGRIGGWHGFIVQGEMLGPEDEMTAEQRAAYKAL